MKLVDFKIKVDSEAESREVQELLFGLGCGWYSLGRVVNYTEKPYIYKEGKCLCYGYNEEAFNTEKVKEITLQELRNLVEELKVAQQQTKTKDNFIEGRTNIFKKLLQGVKFQYRYNDAGQWHNLTDKSLCHIMKPNVAIREKPQKITIDGIEMDKDTAIKYIEKHY